MSDQENNLNPVSPKPGDEALDQLIYAYLDGTLSPQDEVILTDYLKGRQCIKYFVERCKQEQVMHDLISSNVQQQADASCSFESGLWQELARYEDHAPAIPFEKFVEPIPVENLSPAKVRRVNKTSLIIAIVSIAALITMIAYVNLFPPAPKEPVATLADTMNARWESSNDPVKGERLFAGNALMCLQQGLIKIKFDSGASVIVEAPSTFELNASDQLRLHSGRLYAAVPKEAIGFTVNVENTRIIDLGTEFGVQSDENEAVELHVLKGKTMLIAGAKSDKTSMEVGAGYAKKVFGAAQKISDIVCNDRLFVRKIDSTKGLIWRGQTELDLADIVGGGNGLGTGKIDLGIEPMSGEISKESLGLQKSANNYHSVPANPYIDGVFVPNGRTQQIVSSQGHLFQECPVTSGLCSDIIKNAKNPLDWIASNIKVPDSPVKSILLHSNVGVTFDLQAVRKLFPGVNIARFQSITGIRRWALRPKASNADFWVLVDGKLRFQQKQVKTGELYHIDIELSENDRFLTLIETDGGDPEGRIVDGSVSSPTDSDWGMFVQPVLVLK